MRRIIPYILENKIHVPNHQPVNAWNICLQFGPTWGDVCHVLLRSGPHRQQNAKPQRRDGDMGGINP